MAKAKEVRKIMATFRQPLLPSSAQWNMGNSKLTAHFCEALGKPLPNHVNEKCEKLRPVTQESKASPVTWLNEIMVCPLTT